MTFQKNDKQAIQEWEEFLESIRSSTTIDLNETTQEKKRRIANLEKDPEAWFAYYFPKFCFCSPADFHKKSSLRFLESERIYQCRAWARGLSKSTRRMFEVFYVMFAQRIRLNTLLISKSQDNAIRLLAPYKANLEANQRLIHDYGTQELLGKWTEDEFTTRSKHTFRAVGKGQNPRGAKNDELRINLILFDDLDDDEECLNEDRIDKTWKWVQEAVIPTVDISQPYWICFDNNIIAENSLAKKAQEFATDVEVINIRDNQGKSTWPQKNSEQDIDDILSKISYESGQKEYFNNPMGQGKTFPEITWGKCPPLHTLQYVVIYADPATSNKDKPTAKSKASNSSKAIFLLGKKDLKYYIYTGFLDVMSNAHFIDGLYATHDYAKAKKALQIYTLIENNTLQDPFYEQVLMPLIFQVGRKRGNILSITPDDRKKPDKWFRIEGTLEPLNRMGLLVFNQDEKENPHMKRLEAQFKAAKPSSKNLDGCDCIEGGVVVINKKQAVATPENMRIFQKPVNSKRF